MSWIYYFLYNIFKIEPLNLVYFFKLIDFLLIPIACNYFLKSLNIKNHLKFSIIYSSIPVVTTIGWNNWANYAQIFNGEWYNIPHYLFLFSLGLIVRKKYSFSIFCLLIIFVTHPSKGLALIIATSPIVLFQIFNEKSNKNFRSNTFSIIICSLIASVYSFYVLKDNVTKMSNDEWMRIVDTHSYHFYWEILMKNF